MPVRAPPCPQILIKGLLQTYPAGNKTSASSQKPPGRSQTPGLLSSSPHLSSSSDSLLSTPSCSVPLPSPRSGDFSPTDQSPGMGLELLEASMNTEEPDGGPRALGRAQRYIFRISPGQSCLAGCPAFSSSIQAPEQLHDLLLAKSRPQLA